MFFKAEILVNPPSFNSSCPWPPDIPYIPSCTTQPGNLSGKRAFWDTGGTSVGTRCGSRDRRVRHGGTSLGLWLKCRCCGDTDGKQDISSSPQCLPLPQSGSRCPVLHMRTEKWKLLVGLEVLVPSKAVPSLPYKGSLLCGGSACM